MQTKKIFCLESFPESLKKTFPDKTKKFQTFSNIYEHFKACFHKRINSYCLESLPEILETFPEQTFTEYINIIELLKKTT